MNRSQKIIEGLKSFETVNERQEFPVGQKSFYTMDGIGKAKYTVNAYDGKATHPDGSKFYGIRIFKNKTKLKKHIADLLSQGYKQEN